MSSVKPIFARSAFSTWEIAGSSGNCGRVRHSALPPAMPAFSKSSFARLRSKGYFARTDRSYGGGVPAEREHGRLADAEQHVVHHALAVDGVVQRLTDLLPVERRLGAVDADLVGERPGVAPDHRELACASRAMSFGGTAMMRSQIPDWRAATMASESLKTLKIDPVDPRRALAPVGRVALERRVVAGHPLDELEGPGPAAAVLSESMADGSMIAIACRRSKTSGDTFLNLMRTVPGIRRRHLGHVGNRRKHVEAAILIGRLLEVLDDIGCDQVLPAVELHALPERQGDRLAVGSDDPPLGETGQGLEALVVARQRVVEVLLEREIGEGEVVRVEGETVVAACRR